VLAEWIERLGQDVETLVQAPVAWKEGPREVEIDEMKQAQLRALGYVVPTAGEGEEKGQPRRRRAERKWGDE